MRSALVSYPRVHNMDRARTGTLTASLDGARLTPDSVVAERLAGS